MDGLQWKTPIKMDDLGGKQPLFFGANLVHWSSGQYIKSRDFSPPNNQPNDESNYVDEITCCLLCIYVRIIRDFIAKKKDEHYNILQSICIPRCSMYGLFTYIWVVLVVNVGKYTIHWAYGIEEQNQKVKTYWLKVRRYDSSTNHLACQSLGATLNDQNCDFTQTKFTMFFYHISTNIMNHKSNLPNKYLIELR